jgi:Rps23 Pro-64 3,4-dihydroxylase Tpa1-like proline 4-hydroxylase
VKNIGADQLTDPSINQVEQSNLDPRRPIVPSDFLHRKKLEQLASDNHARYASAKPFPHIALDNLFPGELLDAVIQDLPANSKAWTQYDNVHERKSVFSDVNAFGPAAETFAYALNSLAMVNFIEKLTGIDDLIPDPYLHAAGYMKVDTGGFLDLHRDFTMHKQLPLERRVNVLVYLNHDWEPEWGGQLELHSNDDLAAAKHVEVKINPVFNRTVIFSTPNALHGHREPVACPAGRTRLLFSCFYFTVPPTLGYRALAQKVDFPSGPSLSRSLISIANRVVPPILFDMIRPRK